MIVHSLLSVVLASPAPLQGQDTPARGLSLVEVVHHADFQNREPMLVETTDGTLLVSGFPRLPHEPARAPSLWRSGDGGASWTRGNTGNPADGAVGNSDTDFAMGPDGTVYYVTMGFNRTTGQGTHVAIGISRDQGAVWTWSTLVRADRVDRPWVNVAPDGTVHVIWNDGGGVHHRRSTDGGATWTVQPQVNSLGGSGSMAVGPGGELAVRVTPVSASGAQYDEGVDLVAVSTDKGVSWNRNPPPEPQHWAPRTGQAFPRWVEPLAWDASGRLYYLWSAGRSMWLGRSTDRGRTWDTWKISQNDGSAYYPFLVAGNDGELAATWFSGVEGGSVRVALIKMEGDAGPSVQYSEPLRYESWQAGESGRVRDPNGEYVPISFLSDGDVGVVTPLQDPDGLGVGFTWWRLRRN